VGMFPPKNTLREQLSKFIWMHPVAPEGQG